ncbi:sensor domain-containing protein [Mycolicibacterium mucogenicum]|nr:sensor domain-containing protein [Mycolicibacterium mucogenicum]
MVVPGCSTTVGGSASGPRVSTSAKDLLRTARQALPDAGEVSTAVGSPLQTRAESSVGGVDLLPDGMKDASPIECLGVRAPRMRQTYIGAPVTAVVEGQWATSAAPQQIPDPDVQVVAAVLELDSPDSARSWYSKFVSQWLLCNGTTVRTASASTNAHDTDTAKITQVADSMGVLDAAVLVSGGGPNIGNPLVNQRALTAVSHFLVDVEVTQIGGRAMDLAANSLAIAVVRLIANKIMSNG